MNDERREHGAVDESSLEQQIHESNNHTLIVNKNWSPSTSGTVSVTTCFVTMTAPIQRIVSLVSKHSKLVQLVVQVKYHVNVIYSLGGRHTDTHTHTNIADKSNFKKPGTHLV